MYSPGHPPHRGGNLRLGLERGKEAGTGVSLLRGGPSAESSGQGCLPPEAVRFLGQTCSEIGSQRGPQSPSPWAARGLGVPEPLPPAAPCPGLTAPPGSPTGATHPLQMNLSSSLLLPRMRPALPACSLPLPTHPHRTSSTHQKLIPQKTFLGSNFHFLLCPLRWPSSCYLAPYSREDV